MYIYNARCFGKTSKIRKEIEKKMNNMESIVYYDVDRKNDEYLLMVNNIDRTILPNIGNIVVINKVIYMVKSIAFNYDENKVSIFVKTAY